MTTQLTRSGRVNPARAPRPSKKTGRWAEARRNKHVYLWVLPFVLFFLFVDLYPTLWGFGLSMFDWDGFTPAVFVDGENFIRMAQDPLFWTTTWNTLVLLVLIVPFRTLLALVLAAMINSAVVRRKQFFTSFLLLPNVTAIVVVAIIFQVLLITNGGLINTMLVQVGIPAVPWLDSTEWSKVSLAILNLWKATGYFTLIMLAGLQQIPKTTYEAAQLDGAGPIRSFFSITVPQMRNVIIFVVIVSTIWLVQNIADAMVLTQGGPSYSSTPLMYFMFIKAFEQFDLGYAAAISLVLFVMMSLLSAGTFAVNRKTTR